MSRLSQIRETTQPVVPIERRPVPDGQYDIYPAFPVENGQFGVGFAELAEVLRRQKQVIIDGYEGVFWEHFRQQVDQAFAHVGVTARWIDVAHALLPPAQIDQLISPFLGDEDPLFGTRFTGTLSDFFDGEKLAQLAPAPEADVNIVYGCGAALSGWDAFTVYVDLPKDELQFRSRAGSVHNLGAEGPQAPKQMYKRFYFVDWVALNRHKQRLLAHLDLIVDGQRADVPVFTSGDTLRATLTRVGSNYFRVRPWFEPGPWGGQWMLDKIPQLPRGVPNYAWSFELITPENGLLLESDDLLLEISFDWLMYQAYDAVLGDAAPVFGYEFPIRFDFLDTVNGGNLSLQCHPHSAYIKEHFGETFTQDETYYILDCEPGARVYLGFQKNVDPQAFRRELERSFKDGSQVDVEQFVQTFPCERGDLFLIPNGTIHCSGAGNMVLEISATPYIFTFKMYDWLRLGLDGKPRPLNIERAFANLDFTRQGARVPEKLVATPVRLQQGQGWQLFHLPTHPEHFYDIHRIEIEPRHSACLLSSGSVHVLSLVEGQSVLLETEQGMQQRFSYAETFVVPAAAGSYRLTNPGSRSIKVIKAFIKPIKGFEI